MTQGSHKAIIPRGQATPIVIEDRGQAHKVWRRQVAKATDETMTGPPCAGPVALRMVFLLPAPASPRYRYPAVVGSGDIDKYERAVLDALTGRVFNDDSQVVALLSTKRYDVVPGVEIEVDDELAQPWVRWALGRAA